ncbi:MAG: hypothetical protein MUD12_01335 [Spirochaetes bacterium]|jgi:hypothetical protein|nr:hypothetical protein [Spirochaetota bacterium]
MMNLKDIVVRLDVSDVRRILAIDMDENREDALIFKRNNLPKKVRKALESH